MDTKKIKEEILNPLKEKGFLILDLKEKTIEGKKILEITIDKIEKKEKMSTRDCQIASKIIEEILDEKQLINQRYYLVVFSKGIENED
jgi:ribosome maturation factor RimP